MISKRKFSKEKIILSLEVIGSVSFLFFLLTGAIDKKTQELIFFRANGRCESKLRDQYGRPTNGRCTATNHLEFAHKQHGDNKQLNQPNNIDLYCIRCHYFDHLHRSRNRLSKGANDWTLYQLWHRMTPEERKGIPEPPIPKKNNIFRR